MLFSAFQEGAPLLSLEKPVFVYCVDTYSRILMKRAIQYIVCAYLVFRILCIYVLISPDMKILAITV